jgi:Ca-activated chloride channel homolog
MAGLVLAFHGMHASPAAQFASHVNLVEVYVTVTDAQGRPVQGLTRADFEVLEDGELQEIGAFAAGDFPLSAALAVDRSWSMSEAELASARSAARIFLGELRPADQAMIIAVGTDVQTLSALSSDRAAHFNAIAAIDRWGTTSLHDAIITAVRAIQPASGRRALVLLSDGDDRYSRASAAEALGRVREADVLIYPIALGARRPTLFAELAALTGGRSAHVRDARQLPDTLREIARELRQQYLIGYTPSRPLDTPDEWRSIQVRVPRGGMQVRARDGYLVQ